MTGRAPRIVLATRNEGKLVELRAILEMHAGAPDVASSAQLDVPDVRETGVTFAENALLKARATAEFTGLPSIADDSGLAVDVLGGSPGVFSARWSGTHGDDLANLELLLAQLSDVPEAHRAARFVCAAALVTPDGAEHVEHGYFPGTLEFSPRGRNGFGYDPILRVDGDPGGRTAAELEPAEKNRLSHRGQAFRALRPHIVEALAG
ncbi:RdgB/HAM1 family non-canonical purine NTP pyrophosphatase [Spelaeicoccus albus]|uniref:dITP/XTP pyrophosphatase n=1 Tax=Spelaeicoccus albus TaxID=1280376 RepID=A0A7Z0D5E5_9MICO|nr:RdgB/HAM1 family non-canonical purine NTP pyrophosphatase [Spelaeicoccus albus]NYI69221.1 XTP/dITP diphosphohydrolase [Spelaeicoccus albus]